MDIDQALLTNESTVRLASFLGVFAIIAFLEILLPRRNLLQSKRVRWANNLGLVVLNTVVLRLFFPGAAVGMAAYSAGHGWGLFNQFAVPYWLAVSITVIALDFVIWLQHVTVHAVPALWRLHRVHHADLDYDVTTGARFHPIEIVLSMAIKFAAIIVLGPPVAAVVLFEVLLNATAMFNHGNVRLPSRLDKVLRWVIVTPNMHRVHHSTEPDESNANFGFNFPWWDRLFKTYLHQPRAGHESMTIGVRGYNNPREVTRLDGMLMMPFRPKTSSAVPSNNADERKLPTARSKP